MKPKTIWKGACLLCTDWLQLSPLGYHVLGQYPASKRARETVVKCRVIFASLGWCTDPKELSEPIEAAEIQSAVPNSILGNARSI